MGTLVTNTNRTARDDPKQLKLSAIKEEITESGDKSAALSDHDTDEEAKITGTITNSIKFKEITEHDNNATGFCCIFGSSKKNKQQDK